MNPSLRLLLCAGVLCVSLPATNGGEIRTAPAGKRERPLRIIEKPSPEFPRKLLTAGITGGEVRLFLNVDPDGMLTDHLIVAFTHYEFANEVSKAVARWRYEPTLMEGRAIATTVALNIRFEVSGVHVVERRLPEDRPPAANTFMFRARELCELDQPPQVLFSVAPPNPGAPGEPALSGRARVEFYIDELGHVRMPTVGSADDERLGWAALAAIAGWEFEVPKRGGYPVLARASQVFVFRPKELPISSESEKPL